MHISDFPHSELQATVYFVYQIISVNDRTFNSKLHVELIRTCQLSSHTSSFRSYHGLHRLCKCTDYMSPRTGSRQGLCFNTKSMQLQHLLRLPGKGVSADGDALSSWPCMEPEEEAMRLAICSTLRDRPAVLEYNFTSLEDFHVLYNSRNLMFYESKIENSD